MPGVATSLRCGTEACQPPTSPTFQTVVRSRRQLLRPPSTVSAQHHHQRRSPITWNSRLLTNPGIFFIQRRNLEELGCWGRLRWNARRFQSHDGREHQRLASRHRDRRTPAVSVHQHRPEFLRALRQHQVQRSANPYEETLRKFADRRQLTPSQRRSISATTATPPSSARPPSRPNSAMGLAGFDRTHTLARFRMSTCFPLAKASDSSIMGSWPRFWEVSRSAASSPASAGLPSPCSRQAPASIAAGQTQTANQLNPVVAIWRRPRSTIRPTLRFRHRLLVQSPLPPWERLAATSCADPAWFNINQNVLSHLHLQGWQRSSFSSVGRYRHLNLTNTPTFSNPNTTRTVRRRSMQTASINYGNYSVITSTASTARQLQVGATLRF